MKNVFKSVALAAGIMVAAQVANAQQKVGHVNSEEILTATADYKNAEATLKTLYETKQKEYQGMVDEFNKKLSAAQEKQRNRSEANKDQIDSELQVLDTELQQMQQRIQENQRVAQEDVGKKQQELMEPIQQKVLNAINTVAKEKGYAYVLDIATGGVIYFAGGEDISADVKAKLGVQ